MYFKKRWVSCKVGNRRQRKQLSIVLDGEVGFDKSGHFYMSRWFHEFTGKTPRERLAEKFAAKEKLWIPYPDGLGSILRGVTLAIADGNYRLPTLKEIQKLAEEFQAELTFAQAPQELKSYKKALAEAAEILKLARRPELKEARRQLILLLPLRDSLGRFNIGMLRATTTAATARLIERISGIYSWLPHFVGRQAALENLRQKVVSIISRLNKNLKAGLVIWPTELDFLLAIKPFTQWAKLTLGDLKKARQLMKEGKLVAAQKRVNQVLQAIKVAGVMLRLEQVIEEMDFDLWQERKRPAYFRQKLTVIGNRLKNIKEVGFKQPVCQKALTILRQAYRSLNDLAAAKSYLKAASQTLAGH